MTQQTMSPLPPALAGAVVAGPGKRVGALLIDGLIKGVLFVAAWLASILGLLSEVGTGGNDDAAMGFIMLPLMVILPLMGVVAFFIWTRGLTPGHALLGVRMVAYDTGQAPRGKGVLWFLFMEVLAGFTGGIGHLVLVLIVDSSRRNWCDRALGVVVVDKRVGADPLKVVATDSAGSPTTPPPPPPVDFDGELGRTVVAVPGSHGAGMPSPLEGAVTHQPVADDELVFAPAPPPRASAAPPADSPALGGSAQDVPGLITNVPWLAADQQDKAPATAPEAGPPVVQAVPGAPPVPASAPRAPEPAAPAQEFDDRTSIGAPRPQALLRVDTGQRIALTTELTVLGRSPEGRGQWAQAEAVAVDDPDMSVSKTHLGLRLLGDELWVHDFGSTNGTALVLPEGAGTAVSGPEPLLVPTGATIRMGQRLISVER